MPRISTSLALVAMLGFAPIVAHAADEPSKVTSTESGSSDQDHMERLSNHLAGHIAFLKAELMITPTQESAWDKVADAMHDDVNDYEDASAKLPQSQAAMSAIDSLSQRQQFAELRAKGEKRFLNAFKPLYDSFSAEQKQAADDLFQTRDGS